MASHGGWNFYESFLEIGKYEWIYRGVCVCIKCLEKSWVAQIIIVVSDRKKACIFFFTNQ